MPIVGQHDMAEAHGEPIDDRHDRVAVGDRERAAGAEIVLHVDDQQQIVVANLHFGPGLEQTSSCPALCRASTSCVQFRKRKTWMAGPSPATTKSLTPCRVVRKRLKASRSV